LKVSSPAGYSLEVKPEARVACQVTMAVLFAALLVTAITFAGGYQGFRLMGNISEILWGIAQAPCSQGSSPTQEDNLIVLDNLLVAISRRRAFQ